jgi:hypothetical protein
MPFVDNSNELWRALLTTIGGDADGAGTSSFHSAGETVAALKALRRREIDARATCKRVLNRKLNG